MQLKKIPFREFLIASIILDVLAILTFFALKSFLPPVVPLLYGRPSGEGELVPVIWLLIAPVIAILITFVNTLVSNYTEDIFIRKLLITTTFLISLLTSITFLKIIFLVGFF